MKVLPARTVLVVDDDEDVQKALSRLLGLAGYTVLTAENGEEGLRILADHPVQLVISDQNMPGMSGIDFLKAVRERHRHVLRMMLTADQDPETVVRSINEGEVHRFIRKPWDNASLRTMVHFAFEVVLLEEENRQLLSIVRRQRAELRHVRPTVDAEAELVLAEADLLER
jgi:response regulator RpfG family c-di-GMP phosphodiesterase